MARLYYLIGASGAGKDALMRYARTHVAERAPIVFAHRYITRPAEAGGENHIALSEREFHQRRRMRCFAMNWHSHDTDYGVGIEIDQWLQRGLNVVVNGSRAYLEQAAHDYPQLVPVLIDVRTPILRARLKARSRENAQAIEHRLAQAARLASTVRHPQLHVIDNNRELDRAGRALLTLIDTPSPEPCD